MRVEPCKYLEIAEWQCFHEGRSATVEALEWFREQGYRFIGGNAAPASSAEYWARMKSRGLAEAVMMQSSPARKPSMQ